MKPENWIDDPRPDGLCITMGPRIVKGASEPSKPLTAKQVEEKLEKMREDRRKKEVRIVRKRVKEDRWKVILEAQNSPHVTEKQRDWFENWKERRSNAKEKLHSKA